MYSPIIIKRDGYYEVKYATPDRTYNYIVQTEKDAVLLMNEKENVQCGKI